MAAIPYLKKTLTSVYGLPIDAETKAELRQLKIEFKVDVNRIIRDLIKSEIPKIKKAVGA